MEQKNYKYEIRCDKIPILLTAIMVAIFGGITLWLKIKNEGAFIFIGIFTALMLLLFLMTIYRYLFNKVLISDEGFYYQSSISNGKYYLFKDVEKAWISSGVNQNGVYQEYCNIFLFNKSVIRFEFKYNGEDGVQYLLNRVEEVGEMKYSAVSSEKENYLIDGKAIGKARIIFGITILAIFIFVTIAIYNSIGFNIMLIPPIIIGLVICWILVANYIFFKVRIEKDSFYCRTSPFNGQWYKYVDVIKCKEIRKASNYQSDRSYYYFFEFTDSSGKTRKFQFSKEINEYEVNILKERIDRARGINKN